MSEPEIDLSILTATQTRRAMALLLARYLFPYEGPANLAWVAKYIEKGHHK